MDKLKSPWATRFVCTDHGDWCVLQGAADYCAEHGHAYYIVDGVDRGHCPRCGVLTDSTDSSDSSDSSTDSSDSSDTDTVAVVTLYDNLQLCGCCAEWVSNHEACHCPRASHPYGVGTLRTVPNYVNVVVPASEDADKYDPFYWSVCVGCGTDLAGERYTCSGLAPVDYVDRCDHCAEYVDYCPGHGEVVYCDSCGASERYCTCSDHPRGSADDDPNCDCYTCERARMDAWLPPNRHADGSSCTRGEVCDWVHF